MPSAAANNKSEIQLRRRRKTSDDGDDLINRPAARKRRTRRLQNDDDNCLPCLPHELVVGNILNRLPAKSLMRFNCVSKFWYDSIHKDQNFASFHLNQSLQNPPLMFHVLNYYLDDWFRSPLFLLDDMTKLENNKDDVQHVFSKLISLTTYYRLELVGSCNGLVCLSTGPFISTGFIVITNPSRSESLFLNLTTRHHEYILCYGFGFDSLTNEYKVVLIVCTNYTVDIDNCEFKCLIFTLGGGGSNNNSWRWRETSTRPPIGNPPPTEDGITTRMNQQCFYRSAIFCGGALFWRTRSDNPTAANENMLLSFDLHQEKFQAIPLPVECYAKSNEQQQHQLVDPLIEFRGSPCVPHIENIGGGCDHRRRRRQHFDCVVHFHILIDKVKKVWTKETFDVHISSSSLHSPIDPRSCGCFFGTTTPTPTRIYSSSNRGVLLYWFNGEYLQFYNLHTKHVKVARCSLFDDFRWVFRNKKHTLDSGKDGCNQQLCPMDYYLNHHVENLFCLETLIPRGTPKVDYDADKVNPDNEKMKKSRLAAGYLFVQQKKSSYYYLLN